MKSIKKILCLVLVISILGCKDDKAEENKEAFIEGVSTFYFIRHAEKDRSNPANSDPELSQKGLGRAMHWNKILRDANINTIYSTNYQRTSMTAAPTSIDLNIDIEYYDPRIIDIDKFKTDNLNRNVLVVGHSNTTPDFVNKMIGEEKYESMSDDDNGSLFIVQIVNEIPTVQRLHFSCNCPD